jgi:hypothetical protein
MATHEKPGFDLWCRVRAKGLVQSAQHNGKTAVVIALADPDTGRFGVRLQDGVEVRMKPCNLEPLSERECFQEDLRQEIIKFQQFVSSKPFPSLETCIRNLNTTSARSLECYGSDPQYASLLSSEVYAISRSIYQTFEPQKDSPNTSVKAAGERLYVLGGKPAMEAVNYLLTGRHNGFLSLQYVWDGIGSWRA